MLIVNQLKVISRSSNVYNVKHLVVETFSVGVNFDEVTQLLDVHVSLSGRVAVPLKVGDLQ